MEKVRRMLGVVTLYNPNKEEALCNIASYLPWLDALIIWDNSQVSNAAWFVDGKVCYHWTGNNTCIAPAINYSLQLAKEKGYDSILIMDEDSQWEDFVSYRQDIERRMSDGEVNVFTPYVIGCDTFDIVGDVQAKRLFINSGTVIPTRILSSIGGVDEKAFPLDALDHDIAMSVIENGFAAVCLTSHRLIHSLGHPKRLGPFKIFTPDYNGFRTYSMTRSHIICYRKHVGTMNSEERRYLWSEILFWKFVRIILAEGEKLNRMKMYIKGIIDGCMYKIR